MTLTYKCSVRGNKIIYFYENFNVHTIYSHQILLCPSFVFVKMYRLQPTLHFWLLSFISIIFKFFSQKIRFCLMKDVLVQIRFFSNDCRDFIISMMFSVFFHGYILYRFLAIFTYWIQILHLDSLQFHTSQFHFAHNCACKP